jgi:hypothetical protein
MSKSLIRLTSNTKPFNRVELGVLEYIYKVLKGELLNHSGLEPLIRSNIKGMYGLKKDELMYFYALYQNNYESSGDFSSIESVDVPKMYDYNVNYLQDVSAWRSTDHSVIAADEHNAAEAMDYDFGYGEEQVSSYVGDYVETGDAHDVFDTEITHNQHEPINETRIIIKNILKEYKK